MPKIRADECSHPEWFCLCLEEWNAFVGHSLLARNVEANGVSTELSVQLAQYLVALKWARKAFAVAHRARGGDLGAVLDIGVGADSADSGINALQSENLHDGPGARLLVALAEAFREQPLPLFDAGLSEPRDRDESVFEAMWRFDQHGRPPRLAELRHLKKAVAIAIWRFEADFLALLRSELESWRQGKWDRVCEQWQFSVCTYFRRFIDLETAALLAYGEPDDVIDELDEVGLRRRLAGHYEEDDQWRREYGTLDVAADRDLVCELELPWNPWPWCRDGDADWNDWRENRLAPSQEAEDFYALRIDEFMVIPCSLLFGPLFDLLMVRLEEASDHLEKTLFLGARARGVFDGAIREVRSFVQTPWSCTDANRSEKALEQRERFLKMLDELLSVDDEREQRAFIVSKLVESTARICAAVRGELAMRPDPAVEPTATTSTLTDASIDAAPARRAPIDLGDCVAAKTCRTAVITTHKLLMSLLKRHPEIRSVRKGKHRFVHAGDWGRYRQDEQNRLADDPKVTKAMAEEIATRYERVREKKASRGEAAAEN